MKSLILLPYRNSVPLIYISSCSRAQVQINFSYVTNKVNFSRSIPVEIPLRIRDEKIVQDWFSFCCRFKITGLLKFTVIISSQ